MVPAPQRETFCAQLLCPRSFPDHRWGAIKASGEGWFLQRNGVAWCPDHTPDWVSEWRARKGPR